MRGSGCNDRRRRCWGISRCTFCRGAGLTASAVASIGIAGAFARAWVCTTTMANLRAGARGRGRGGGGGGGEAKTAFDDSVAEPTGTAPAAAGSTNSSAVGGSGRVRLSSGGSSRSLNTRASTCRRSRRCRYGRTLSRRWGSRVSRLR